MRTSPNNAVFLQIRDFPQADFFVGNKLESANLKEDVGLNSQTLIAEFTTHVFILYGLYEYFKSKNGQR